MPRIPHRDSSTLRKMEKPEIVLRDDLVSAVASRTSASRKVVSGVIDAVFSEIARNVVAGKACSLRRFGVFLPAEYRSHLGRNPKKPDETCVVPGGRTVKFHPGVLLKRAMNEATKDRAGQP